MLLRLDALDQPILEFLFLYSQVAQQVCTEVAESFTSYKELLPLWYAGQLIRKPKLPKYRKKGGYAGFTYPKQALLFNIESGLVRLPVGNTFKAESGVDALYIQMPHNISFENIKELRILPRNACIYAEFVCSKNIVALELDKNTALAIDHGINNWLSCVLNTGDNSFIVDGLGSFIHADCNAAANMFRKVETQLGLSLARVCRGVLTLPTRVFLWNIKSKKRRGRCEF